MRGFLAEMPFRFKSAALALTILTAVAVSLHADERTPKGPQETGRGQLSDSDAESIRGDLLSTLDVYDRMSNRRGLISTNETVKFARERVRRMSNDELAPFRRVAPELSELRRLTAEFETIFDDDAPTTRLDDDGGPLRSSTTGACCDTSTGTCSDGGVCAISVCSLDDSIVCSDKVCSNDGTTVCTADADCPLNNEGLHFDCVDFDCGANGTCIPTGCSSDLDCTTPTTTIDQGTCDPGLANADCQGDVIFHAGLLCSDITCDKENDPTDGSFPGRDSPGTACTNTRADTDLTRGLLVGVQAGRVVAFVANALCGQDAAGFNAELACIATDEVFLAAESVFNHLLRCVDDVDSREIEANYKRAGHIHSELQTAQSSSTGTSLLVNKNLLKESRSRIVDFIDKMSGQIATALHDAGKKIQALFEAQQNAQNEEVRAFRAYTMQMLIEEDLGTPFSQNREARFQLPRSFICTESLPPASEPYVPCGGLEDVADLVDLTIDNMVAAGMPTFDAVIYRNKADHAFEKGFYKEAYFLYAKAYRLATGLEAENTGPASRKGRRGLSSNSRLTGGGR